MFRIATSPTLDPSHAVGTTRRDDSDYSPEEARACAPRVPLAPKAQLSRHTLHFPQNFVWGTATAAVQIEGGATAGGKGESVWDRFAATPGKTHNGDTPAVACDHYHRYREDFSLMRELGIRHYRFSLAWPRIIPDGDGAVNQAGIDFYNRLFDAMTENGITPWVTMFHWDLPQSLEDRFGGWRSRRTIDAFARYADTVVKVFGDRVRHWFTLNEIIAFTRNGYGIGRNAPGLREPDAVVNQTWHHALVCHGHGVRAVREHGAPGSTVGLVNNPRIPIPLTPGNPADLAAARQSFINENVRIYEPLCRGAYTDAYLRVVGEANQPHVAPGDFDLITLPTDFHGLNIYAGFYVRAGVSSSPPPPPPAPTARNTRDNRSEIRPEILPFPSSFPMTDSDWYQITPQAIYWCPRLLTEIYGAQPLYIAENGCGYSDEPVTPNPATGAGEVIDLHRQELLRNYLRETHRAITDGVPIRGYFLWSFMDNFEWGAGYSVRFGIVHTDYATQRRTPKLSARWYADLIRTNHLE
ncbi:GH1 family beta-glucosidase [Geminisphaera colitermitum]|uniref:GH1 family beta-glucosidase n=1 Tax=Geminisphaera colitermitum TaxID=1148786 RepID=UPI000196532E|nr:GH1 family beta-glucosidase [Geminisphaera colitermitum]